MQKLMYQIYLSLESLTIIFEDKSIKFEDKLSEILVFHKNI